MDPDPSGSYLFQILLLVVLIIINAFFAAAEMATVSVNRGRIETLAEEGKKSAIILQGLFNNSTRFLSVIQVCITFAGFLQSAVAATSMADEFASVITSWNIPYPTQIAVVVITFVLAFFNLVFGELVPKRLALQYSEKIALLAARPVKLFSILMFPFVWLLSITVSLILRIFGIKDDKMVTIYSEDDIRMILDAGEKSGDLDETGIEMIQSVFEFDDKLAYEIMTPRTDIYMKCINDPLPDYVDELLKSRFSRVPYYDKDNDDIIGVLYMKDFFIKAKKVGFNRVNIKKILQKPFFVPESKKIDDLFEVMKDSKKHMAFLVDEYGGLSGIVTTEDIVEEVMGNIDDEYDDAEAKIESVNENKYSLDGHYYIDDLNDELNLKLESDDYETIGGLLIDQLGEIVDDDDDDEKQVVTIDNCVFTIESWKDRRIDKITLDIVENPEAYSEENDEEKK